MIVEPKTVKDVLDLFEIRMGEKYLDEYDRNNERWQRINTGKPQLKINAHSRDLPVLTNNYNTPVLKYAIMGPIAIIIFRIRGGYIVSFKLNMLVENSYSSFTAVRYYNWEDSFKEIDKLKKFKDYEYTEIETNQELEAIMLANKMETK
jgi:hypothetical protein